MRVACIGEAMVELSFDAEGKAGVGFAGDTLNTAIYLKRAEPAFGVDYVTRVGADSFSARLLEFMESEGIGTGLIGRSETRNVGLYAIDVDGAGERSFTYWRGQSAAREMFEIGPPVLDDLMGFDLLLVSAITLAVLSDGARAALTAWLGDYRAAGGRVAFDSNYRPKLWASPAEAQNAIEALWRQTDLALPSVDDEMAIFGDASEEAVIERLTRWGVSDGALKCGASGPRSLGHAVHADYPPAQVVRDTTAAGDSFNGGYLAARLGGADQATALRAGHDLAAQVLGYPGAIIPRG